MHYNLKDRRKNFLLGRWLVQPDRNRVSNDGEEVQVEPRVMDLLLFLADHAGEVLSRSDIIEAVWKQDFVGDTTLSSAVAVLRRALDDDAREPRYIETIAKRGYRLVADVVDPSTTAKVTPFPGLFALQERSPYPGLAAFEGTDADHFFGRDQEAIALWDKITRQNFLAVIGPSGVGKSSFVRAGIIPSRPKGWSTLVFEPGEAPFGSLARAMAPEFANDPEAVQQLLACHDPDIALALVSRWRERSSEALLIIDQFEELFTLSSNDVQFRFAELLSRLARAARIHIVLVMRDDFLYECHCHPGLEKVYKDLTVLRPLAANNLRSAMIEPALREGYRFEDEALAGEMIAEVTAERGATPMLAFALSRMWELRDRERKLITRQAHDEIGGVAGALALHAERVMEKIGDRYQPLVREIFRNLVTCQRTRVVREVGELLSVFPDDQQASATKVLQELVDGRLLTTFEVHAGEDESAVTRHRIEIVHESLLTAWPRLVRWQTQDAHAAQLRDQIRQAAHLWNEHNRSIDLLWAGSAFRELRVWQEQYPGGLSRVERAFFKAMVSHAGRRRRRRRIVKALFFVAIVAVAVTVTSLWRKSLHHIERLEARRLYHAGIQLLDSSPPAALAYAIASLELSDDFDVRLLALNALGSAPMPTVIDTEQLNEMPVTVAFSHDGKWLSVGHLHGSVSLWSSTGEQPKLWRAHERAVQSWFMPGSGRLITRGLGDPRFSVWSVPQAQILDTFDGPFLANDMDPREAANFSRLSHFKPDPDSPGGWKNDSRGMIMLERLQSGRLAPAALSPDGERMVYALGAEVYEVELGEQDATPHRVAQCPAAVEHVVFHPEGKSIATYDVGGVVQFWEIGKSDSAALNEWQGPKDDVCDDFRFSVDGHFVGATYDDGSARLWGLSDPPGADPLQLSPLGNRMIEMAFHPKGIVIATASLTRVGLWSFDRSAYPFVLRGHSGGVEEVVFAPNGSFLVSLGQDGTVRKWPLEGLSHEKTQVLYDWGHHIEAVVGSLVMAPDGRFVVSTGGENNARLIPIDGSPTKILAGFDQRVLRAAIGPNSRLVAVPGLVSGRLTIRFWELVTDTVSDIFPHDFPSAQQFSASQDMIFTPDGQLMTSSDGRLVRWDLSTMEPHNVGDGIGQFRSNKTGSVVISGPNYDQPQIQTATVHNLAQETTIELTNHGQKLVSLALDFTGTIAITGSSDGIVRVGTASGDQPHLLVGHTGAVSALAVSPDGQCIASAGSDNTIRVWPMPDLDSVPLHILPYHEFLAHLEKQTNLRIVIDEENPNGELKATGSLPRWD